MRIVLVGATPEGVDTAKLLIERGHDVVIVDNDRDVITRLSDELDCGFLCGDGTRPEVLREADPLATDVLFCLTDHDQVNILSGLVGQSLGFKRVITSIEDPAFEDICGELGLQNTIVPARTISRYLADLVIGLDVLELRTIVKGEARFFSFTANEGDAVAVGGLELPNDAKAICLYRGDEFLLADDTTKIHKGDEVVLLTHARNLTELRKRWTPKVASSEDNDRVTNNE